MISQSFEWTPTKTRVKRFVSDAVSFPNPLPKYHDEPKVHQPSRMMRTFHLCSWFMWMIKISIYLILLSVTITGIYFLYTSVTQVTQAVTGAISYPLDGFKDCFQNGNFKGCAKGVAPVPSYIVENYPAILAPVDNIKKCFTTGDLWACYRGFMPLPAYVIDVVKNKTAGHECRKHVKEFPPDGIPCTKRVPISDVDTDLDFLVFIAEHCKMNLTVEAILAIPANCCFGNKMLTDNQMDFSYLTTCKWDGNFDDIFECPCQPPKREHHPTPRSRRVKRM